MNYIPSNAKSSQSDMNKISLRMWPNRCSGHWRKACIGNTSLIGSKTRSRHDGEKMCTDPRASAVAAVFQELAARVSPREGGMALRAA
jgi:hypothetical protein